MTEHLPDIVEAEVVPRRHFRQGVPEDHKESLDTRVAWLWMQRFGTVQKVYEKSADTLDRTAATLILQAIFGKDLESIRIIFQRLEGGPMLDETLLERQETQISI